MVGSCPSWCRQLFIVEPLLLIHAATWSIFLISLTLYNFNLELVDGWISGQDVDSLTSLSSDWKILGHWRWIWTSHQTGHWMQGWLANHSATASMVSVCEHLAPSHTSYNAYKYVSNIYKGIFWRLFKFTHEWQGFSNTGKLLITDIMWKCLKILYYISNSLF